MRSSTKRPMPKRKRSVEPCAWHRELMALQSALRHGDRTNQSELDSLAQQWQARFPHAAHETEPLVLVDETGLPFEPQLQAPRWLCHALALRHACAHVLLLWDSPKLGSVFLCQVRSWDKKDFPGHIDLAVGGHVVGNAGTERSAWIEMREELGVGIDDLTEEGLRHIGGYECFVTVEEKLFYDVEWRDVYLGTVRSLESVHFADGEVAGLYLCPITEGVTLLSQQQLAVANGLSMSLPLGLDYLDQQNQRKDS